MAYIGKSPTGTGVRSRFYYTQTSGGGTSISGTDDNSKTLTFTDGEYIDVFLNGVLLVAGTDYNTNTANTISGLAALANGDVVEVVVYDIFTVADTVSASQGGTFNAAITANQVNADNIRIDGNTISSTDTNGDITLDPNGTGSVAITGGFTATDGCTITTADNDAQLSLVSTDADSTTGPVLDLVRDSASPADGDAIGRIKFTADNDAGEATTYSTAFTTLRDATDGSEDGQVIHYAMRAGSLVDHLRFGRGSADSQSAVTVNEGGADIDFRVESDNDAHAFFVRGSDGFTGVGTSGPNAPLEVSASSTNDNIGAFIVYNKNTANNAAVAAFSTSASSTSTSNVLLRFGSNNYAAGQGMITANGAGSAAFGAFSDRSLKENIADLPSQLANIMALRPVEFDFIASEGGGHQIGFIAQEVEEIYPDLVGENDDGIKMLAGFDKTTARLVKALQEAIAKIETLETKVAALEAGQ